MSVGRQGKQGGRRTEAVPDRGEHPWRYRWVVLKWRAGLAVSTHPVMVALIIALAVVTMPVIQILNVTSDVRVAQVNERIAQVRLDQQQEQIASLVTEIQKDRAKASVAFCKRLNGNQRQAAKLTLYLKKLIISGAQQGKAFESLYRKYGFPPYRVILRRAKRQARKIASFRPAPLNCRQIELRITRDTPDTPVTLPPEHGNP